MVKIKKENRNGVELEIVELDGDVIRTDVTNWPILCRYYTDKETRMFSAEFDPSPIKRGSAFPEKDRQVERVVLPFAMAAFNWGEYGGVDLENHRPIVEFANHYLHGFTTKTDKGLLDKAVELEYLRARDIEDDGKVGHIYIPTRKAIRAICNTKVEMMCASIGMHTGVNIGTGHIDVSQYGD